MKLSPPLAFVDLETTGLGPGTHRIAEIGVVTLDDRGSEEWSSLINPGRPALGQRVIEGVDESELAAAPRFADIAHDLVRRFEGRVLVAHNARFDYAFLQAEFRRVGVAFDAKALCTVMLSRKLYPQEASHNLDALMQRHGLSAEVRHRALPDARVLHQFWQVLNRDFSERRLTVAVDKLLAEPLLPPHLDLGLIQALPEKPGVYVMRGQANRALRIARATNLRREVKAYFRLDRISPKGAKLSYGIRNIEWQVCDGALSARLQELVLAKNEGASDATPFEVCSIRVDPAAQTIAQIVPATTSMRRGEPLFGLFTSERKAKNALTKLAGENALCHGQMGLAPAACGQCHGNADTCNRARSQHLMLALKALSALRLQAWPYAGPVGIREGRIVHVVDQWQLLGSARTASEIAELAQLRPCGFDPAVFRLLNKALPRLPARRLKTLRPVSSACDH